MVALGVVGVFVLLLAGGATVSGFFVSQTGLYNDFAQCLTDSGVKMYGAYWCKHCQAQKSLFGPSFKKINYVECDLGNGQGMRQACAQEGVESYPTWIFADGSKLTGEQSFAHLAEKTGCQMPG